MVVHHQSAANHLSLGRHRLDGGHVAGDGQDVELVVDDDAHLAGGEGQDEPGVGGLESYLNDYLGMSEFRYRSLISR